MSHQNSNAKAYVTGLGVPPESHHNKPEEHKEDDEYIEEKKVLKSLGYIK